MRRAIFFDRDGVLNSSMVLGGKPYPPKDLSELNVMPGAVEVCNHLHDLGYILIGITNQPDVARGKSNKQDVENINSYLKKLLLLDDFKTCFHDDADSCLCRKPLPGLIFESAEKFNLDLKNSYVVGDRWRDIEAGARAGCRTIFIDYGYAEKRPDTPDYNVTKLINILQVIKGIEDEIS